MLNLLIKNSFLRKQLRHMYAICRKVPTSAVKYEVTFKYLLLIVTYIVSNHVVVVTMIIFERSCLFDYSS